ARSGGPGRERGEVEPPSRSIRGQRAASRTVSSPAGRAPVVGGNLPVVLRGGDLVQPPPVRQQRHRALEAAHEEAGKWGKGCRRGIVRRARGGPPAVRGTCSCHASGSTPAPIPSNRPSAANIPVPARLPECGFPDPHVLSLRTRT